MGSEGRRTVRRPQETGATEPACPSCGQPVGTEIQRRKVLGAWVPTWHPRPCGNPDCARFGEAPERGSRRTPGTPEAHRTPDGAPDGPPPRNEPGNSTKIG
ncbi:MULTISPECIES: hypothetical protein [Streptomyces]|uniref:Uncharacterized protein n=1 Tax=Streptomyces changanensis TaxID=2964669 RepID=A0ABY5NA56_9ACTN|nr:MULTISPECIES: hypothetical protein [Streptomyces]UUS32903.1 hypothetical protein NRO40_20160 [Streptomyces changanensis]